MASYNPTPITGDGATTEYNYSFETTNQNEVKVDFGDAPSIDCHFHFGGSPSWVSYPQSYSQPMDVLVTRSLKLSHLAMIVSKR